MSLTRKQMLDEMGLTPQWVLRDEPSVARREKIPAGKAAASAVLASPPPTAEVAAQGASVPAKQPAFEQIPLMDWEPLLECISDCRACGLGSGRKQAVPGVGDRNADWMFIGEGPGAEEDARGEPFVGQAGQLLDAMLAAIDLKRGEDVYIANAVKCRPPGNRTPEAGEMKTCFGFLKRQIELIQPKLIVLLGKAAVHAVLGEEGSLASLRGKSLTYRLGEREIPVVVTYHPAYLLRTLPDKAKAWEDLCRARALMREVKAAEDTPEARNLPLL